MPFSDIDVNTTWAFVPEVGVLGNRKVFDPPFDFSGNWCNKLK
jgi:hypothetical protein